MPNNGWTLFLEICLAARNRQELDDLLQLFLTAEEKNSIKDRYLIIQALLEKKLTQREIADTLKVSIAKITRGSNELKRISPQLWAFLEKHMQSCQ